MRRPSQRRKPKTSELYSYQAPVAGWVANRALTQPNAVGPNGQKIVGAARLDNIFPKATSVTLMRGSQVYAQLGEGELPVTSLFSYVVGSNAQMFAANQEAIYDITTIVNNKNVSFSGGGNTVIVDTNDDIFGWNSTEGLDVSTGHTGGNWVSVQFATAGGTFLRLVNGVDESLVYDGTTFSATPALTYPDTSPASNLSYVWAYKQRLFFIENGTLDAWYLDVDQIGGELTKLPLGGIFERGGALLFGASWSNDSGNQGGLSEQCIFVTTEGEVAVFQGSNPSSADDWSKVGVYRIGKPLGPKAWIRDGGDLIFATSLGMVRISEAIRKEAAALGPTAVSYPIEDAWNDAVSLRSQSYWHCEIWPTQQMALVSVPSIQTQDDMMFIANVRTGAWCRRVNWNGTCLLEFQDRMFFGSTEGKVWEANITGLDDTEPYVGVCVPLFHDFGTPMSQKIAQFARPRVLSPYDVNMQVTMQSDFTVKLPPAPPPIQAGTGSEWGVGIWGSATWGNLATNEIRQDPVSVSGYGYALSPAFQIQSGSVVPIDAELVSIEVTFETADFLS